MGLKTGYWPFVESDSISTWTDILKQVILTFFFQSLTKAETFHSNYQTFPNTSSYYRATNCSPMYSVTTDLYCPSIAVILIVFSEFVSTGLFCLTKQISLRSTPQTYIRCKSQLGHRISNIWCAQKRRGQIVSDVSLLEGPAQAVQPEIFRRFA
jgi:hypothetical protein